MNNLHKIIPAIPQEWVWALLVNARWTSVDGLNHLWVITRRPPATPLDDTLAPDTQITWDIRERNWMRVNHMPWQHYPDIETQDPLTRMFHTPKEKKNAALCGEIKTRSTMPHIYPQNQWGRMPECPRCLEKANANDITPHTIRELQVNDPWNLFTEAERIRYPDPISGL